MFYQGEARLGYHLSRVAEIMKDRKPDRALRKRSAPRQIFLHKVREEGSKIRARIQSDLRDGTFIDYCTAERSVKCLNDFYVVLIGFRTDLLLEWLLTY